jgi:hypothetical protein
MDTTNVNYEEIIEAASSKDIVSAEILDRLVFRCPNKQTGQLKNGKK